MADSDDCLGWRIWMVDSDGGFGCTRRSGGSDTCLQQVASDRNGYHLLQQRIRSRILCSRTAADRIVQNCGLNGITTLEDLSSTDACILSERLGVPPSDIQQLTCSEVQFQASVQSFLKTMQQENFDIEMLQDAAEAISKIAGTVQGLQGVTVMELAAVGVHVKVRVWLAQHRLIQGSGKNGQENFSVQALAAIQESASDLRYVSMESAVLEVKKTLDDGFEPQHLSALTETETLNESRHKNSIEYGQYTERGIFVADGIPSTRDEHAAANLALRNQGFMLIDTTSVVHEVVNSSDFKRKEGGRLFEAVCLDESAARECVRSEEEVLTGVDSDSDEESDDVGLRSDDGFVPCAENGGGGRKGKQGSLPKEEKRSKKAPNITAILVSVHAFLVSIKFETIFQLFTKNADGHLTEDVGDGKRQQAKLRQLPQVNRRKNESDASFYRRSAGREFLFQFLRKVFTLLSDWLPREYTIDRFWDDMFAGVVKTLALARGQHLHADKEPDRHGLGVSVLINLSIWSHWITSLLGSSKNVEALLQYYRQNYDLFATVYLANTPEIDTRSLSEGQLQKILLRPWQCHLNLHVRGHRSSFWTMKLADIELVPVLMAVFSLNHVHGGGPYPGKVPRRLRDYSVPGSRKRLQSTSSAKPHWSYRYGKAHFRSGPKCQSNSSITPSQRN